MASVRTVQILGAARNIQFMPDIPGAERWVFNNPYIYRVRYTPALTIWTHWFNLHSMRHIQRKYPHGYAWYQKQDGSRPIYLRDAVDPTIANSRVFPGPELQQFYSADGVVPFRFITCSVAWALAFAGYQHMNGDPLRIELWGFELKRDEQWAHERPCVSYWVNRLRAMGIDVLIPPGFHGEVIDFGEPGDPGSYTGPLYGYETT